MKKITIFLTLIFSLTLIGCQSESIKEETITNSTNLDRRIGEIKSLGNVLSENNATNILNQEDGTTILLKSDLVDLDNDKYSQKNVEVSGNIVTSTSGTKIMDVKNIDILENSIDITQELPNWVDYNGNIEELNFTYRDDYKIDENGLNEIIIKKTDQDLIDENEDYEPSVINISREILKKDQNLIDFLNLDNLSSSELLENGFSKSKIGKSGYDSLLTESGDKTIYYFQVDNYVYMIAFERGIGPQITQEKNMFFDILGSIQVDGDTAILNEDTDESGDEEKDNDDAKEINDDILDKNNQIKQDTKETKIFNEVDFNEDDLTGYETFESETFDFTVSYPASYYFGSVDASENASRTYEFGTEPLEESSGEIKVDLYNGSVPDGNQIADNVYIDEKAENFALVVKGSNGLYRVSGPSNFKQVITNMAFSIED
ncbi:hypothetical protein GF376_01360 [Candidatus Peregrinibacteria bacterium]|nr:hypothetical protein [Candidatus Peregrinibacteria bacterium]